MGRHHPLRIPQHLYLSPPAPPQPPATTFLPSASSFFALTSAGYYAPSAALLQETGRTTVVAVGDRIPGFKTSAAFFHTLRANLILDVDSTPPSLTNTPDALRPTNMASSTGSLPPPSPSPLVQELESGEDTVLSTTISEDALDAIPELTTKPAVTEDDRVEALHLLADSVAQQRQLAATAAIFHPGTFAVFAVFVGLLYQNLYKGARSDWTLIGTTSAGILMAILITVRWLSSGYIEEAEKVGTWKWLDQGRSTGGGASGSDIETAVGDSDEILLTRFGDEVIGTIIVRGRRENPYSTSTGGTGNSSPKKSRRNLPVTGLIRGWTVKRRYRRKGIGHGLLEEAVTLCQNKGWMGPEFAEDHANSALVLPQTFNGGFRKRERLASEMLEKVKEEMSSAGGSGKKGKR